MRLPPPPHPLRPHRLLAAPLHPLEHAAGKRRSLHAAGETRALPATPHVTQRYVSILLAKRARCQPHVTQRYVSILLTKRAHCRHTLRNVTYALPVTCAPPATRYRSWRAVTSRYVSLLVCWPEAHTAPSTSPSHLLSPLSQPPAPPPRPAAPCTHLPADSAAES
jgi:hypothetical protein